MLLTSESLSRYNRVQILDILTSKNAPNPPVFNDFDFAIALSLQRGAIFEKKLAESCPRPPVLQRYPFERGEAQNFEKTQHFAQLLPFRLQTRGSLHLHFLIFLISFIF
jgi:hypothetical protein